MLRFRRIVPLRARSFATGAPHESEYVTRRRVYNLQVAASRKKFAETTRRLAEEQRALEEATIFSRQGLAAARAARKRYVFNKWLAFSGTM